MKIYHIFFLLISLFLNGCTYNLIKSDFENDEQYYNEINKIAKGRTIVLETKDSTFDSEEIIINEDSLIGKYKSKKYPSFSYERIEKQYTIPIENIKSIAVTTRTSSIARGLGIGLLTGAAWGGTFIDLGGDSNSGHHPDYFVGGVFSAGFGLILGSLAGGIVGDDYVFSFNKRLSREELVQDNSAHKYGLKIGHHSGFTPKDAPVEGHGGNTSIRKGQAKPGISLTLFYNYPLGKNFSLNSELSYISAGSYETYSVGVPKENPSYFNFISSSSIENVKIIETAFLVRLNLLKNTFTPYFILGPKFDLIIPPANSLKEKFYNDINEQYGGSDFSVSGKYKRVLWGAVIGAGLSTGKLFPYEILIEVRYAFDGSARFKTHSHASGVLDYFYYNQSEWEASHISHELIINAGIAIF